MSGASRPNRLTQAQAAACIGVSRATIFRMRVAGTGPEYLQIGGRIYYEPAKIAEWLEKQRRTQHRSTEKNIHPHQATA